MPLSPKIAIHSPLHPHLIPPPLPPAPPPPPQLLTPLFLSSSLLTFDFLTPASADLSPRVSFQSPGPCSPIPENNDPPARSWLCPFRATVHVAPEVRRCPQCHTLVNGREHRAGTLKWEMGGAWWIYGLGFFFFFFFLGGGGVLGRVRMRVRLGAWEAEGCQGEGIATIASVFTLIKHVLSINLGQDRQVAVYGDTSEGFTSFFFSSFFLFFSSLLLFFPLFSAAFFEFRGQVCTLENRRTFDGYPRGAAGCTHARAHTHTHTHTHKHTRIPTHNMHTHTRTHTHILSLTHTHTHTHTHTAGRG